MENVFLLEAGVVQTRIRETTEDVVYPIYSQEHLMADLYADDLEILPKKISTLDDVPTLRAGDLVFNLMSTKAAIVSERHEGYLLTQNFVRIIPNFDLDKSYLLYFLNESRAVKRFFQKEMQGSVTNKVSIKMLEQLPLENLPGLKKQELIGSIYLNQLKLETLKQRLMTNKRFLVFKQLEEIDGKE